jgi:hypothetical protein
MNLRLSKSTSTAAMGQISLNVLACRAIKNIIFLIFISLWASVGLWASVWDQYRCGIGQWGGWISFVSPEMVAAASRLGVVSRNVYWSVEMFSDHSRCEWNGSIALKVV